jgi:hypothetical protein
MTGQENNRPNGLIEHAGPLDPRPPSGTGTGVVWRLKKASTDRVT